MEYDYAVETGKPIIRLLHKDPFGALKGSQIESKAGARKKLEAFHGKLKSSRVCKMWDNPQELMTETILGFHDVIKRHPRDGWVRADQKETAREQFINTKLIERLSKIQSSLVDGAGEAFEGLPGPLLKLDQEGRIISSTPEARALLCFEHNVEVHFSEIFEGLDRPVNDWFKDVIERPRASSVQILSGRGASRETFVQVTLSVAGESADPHLIAVLNDVTALKTLEEQFVQSQKMHAIGQLAGGVAHDFNNLLTAISGHCDLLLLRHDQGDQNYGDLIQIHQNSNRAASLVGQLLAFSRKQNMQLEIIDLRDTLSDLTHLLNRLVGEKVTLLLKHDPKLAQIRADKRQLEQVLMNLIVNARDAMSGGGEIKIVTENMLLKSQMIKDRAVIPAGEYVIVKVSDQGRGIPPDKLQKVFEPFWTTKRTGEGTGLGLSTAYGIVKQTGGYIFVDSEQGVGTTFSLIFRRDDSPIGVPKPGQQGLPEMLQSDANGVILLVEDEAPVRAFAARTLRLRGYEVFEADSGETALDRMPEIADRLNLIISNVAMPGRDGPTWIKEARTTFGMVPVIFISGYTEDAFLEDETPLTNSTFLPKPFSLNALQDVVDSVMTGWKLL